MRLRTDLIRTGGIEPDRNKMFICQLFSSNSGVAYNYEHLLIYLFRKYVRSLTAHTGVEIQLNAKKPRANSSNYS